LVKRLVPQPLAFTSLRLDAAGAVVERLPGHAAAWIEDLGGGMTLELVSIPAGSFVMGSPHGPYPDEQPAHRVSVPAFRLGRGPVTQAQWRAVMGKLASGRFQGDPRPVETVSWHDVQRFCQRLSARTGRRYALPSESQWEYACRAGTQGPFACGETLTTDQAN
jgi:formylglycine-generating enzyme required for sulfatase activity